VIASTGIASIRVWLEDSEQHFGLHGVWAGLGSGAGMIVILGRIKNRSRLLENDSILGAIIALVNLSSRRAMDK